ncbi:MAG: hypothetical protein WA821_07835 [Anaerolineales bacterium]
MLWFFKQKISKLFGGFFLLRFYPVGVQRDKRMIAPKRAVAGQDCDQALRVGTIWLGGNQVFINHRPAQKARIAFLAIE